MNKLIWNQEENKWQCSKCGATFYKHELERCFDFNEQVEDNFVPFYCMDCGTMLKKCVDK